MRKGIFLSPSGAICGVNILESDSSRDLWFLTLTVGLAVLFSSGVVPQETEIKPFVAVIRAGLECNEVARLPRI